MTTKFFESSIVWRTFRWGILASGVCGIVANLIYYVQGIHPIPSSIGSELNIAVLGAVVGGPMGILLGIPTFFVTGLLLKVTLSAAAFQGTLTVNRRWFLYFLGAFYAAFSLGMPVFLLINLPHAIQSGETVGQAVLNSLSYAAMLAPAGFWATRHVLLFTPGFKTARSVAL